MKTLRFLILGLLMTAAVVCRAQITTPGWFAAPDGLQPDSLPGSASLQAASLPSPDIIQQDGQQNNQAIAEFITPDIQALANGLQDDPLKIYNYVQGNIRYVHYFGSKKGAELTLLEKSGNDFDQSALLVALLRAAGYSTAAYQFGWVGVPYQGAYGGNNCLQQWLGLSLSNTNWLYTSNYVSQLFGARGYPALYYGSDGNTIAFQRVWVTVKINTTNYYLDPAFKVSEPFSGVNLTNAMGGGNLISVAGGTDTGNYVSGLSESNIRNTLTGYTTNLLNYIQTNNPNASVQQILGGPSIVPGNFTALGSPLSLNQFTIYNVTATNIGVGNYTNGPVNWSYIPTNLMSSLAISFAGTNWQCWMPLLQGQRLSLTYSNNGLAQLWLNDSNVMQGQTSGSGGTNNVVIDINHPFGHWDWTNNTIIRVPSQADNNVTNVYQSTNATYALVYAFEPDWGWLRERENQLNVYLQEGYPNTSRQVVGETLNIMGLDWMLQTEGAEQLLAVQEGILPQYHHRFGRMAEEAGKGYYVDIYMQDSGRQSAGGADAANSDLQNRHIDLTSYFDSALENGLLEQLQSSNLVAASTVKMLEIASTNGQAVYLASNTNWSTVQGSLSGYDTTSLYNNYISQGYYLLLPQSGTNQLAGPGTWTGYGIAARYLTSTNDNMTMLISGGYNGGYFEIWQDDPDPGTVSQNIYQQPGSTTAAPVGTAGSDSTIADPVDAADGTFQVEHMDLSLGQAEPKGITLSRYYNGTRRYSNPAGMAPGWINNYYINASTVAAPQAALGGTTPAQAAAMIAATCAAINTYNDSPDPKNWLTTALIAKWGVDQMTKGAVSVNLGKDMVQFVKQPNGAFTPPANSTMTLTQSGPSYSLQQRHGNTFNFNSAGQLSGIVDRYGNTLTTTYTNNLVATVADWKGRSFTFNYNASNQLTSVSDGTRSVSYGYTGGDLTSVTDPEGKTTTYNYDASHDITATIDANSQLVVSNVFDSLGHVVQQYTDGKAGELWRIFWSGLRTTEIDPANGESDFYYDDEGRLMTAVDPLGNTNAVFYDGQNHVVETISPLNEINRYFYDGNNNLTSTIDPLNSTNQFIYDSNNNLVQSVDALGHVSTFGYNSQFSLTGSTNGAGDFVNYSYNSDGTLANRTESGGTNTYGYDGYGQLNGISYPNGGSESFVNNSLGDMTSHTDANGNTTTYSYNKRRQPAVTTAPAGLVTSLGYDAVGNALTSTNARGFVIVNAWSPTRKLVSVTLPATAQGVPVITNAYDVRDWLAQTANPLSQALQYTSDSAGRLVSIADPLTRTTKMGYDADGRNIATTNAAGEKTFQQWNKRGQLTMTTDNAGHTVKRGYDMAGNQITLTNRSTNIWHFYYDGANRLTNTVSPLGHSTTLAFNHQGLPVVVTQPSGHGTTNSYDGKGRLTSRTDNVATTAYGYDANNNLTNVSETINSQPSTINCTYDAYNRVSSYHDVYGNQIQYKYDGSGNLTNLVYPGGKNVYYFYDSNNHMTNVTDWAGRKSSIAYDLAAHLTGITRPNGTQRAISYDKDGEATNIVELTATGFPIALFRHNWQASGTMQWEFDAPLPHPVIVPTRTMTYSADNQLATFNGTNVTVDADGNLTYGPLTNSVFTNYTYDARNRLLNAGGVTNAYDPAGNRVGIVQGTNSTIFVVNPNAKLPQVLMRIKNGVTNYYVYGAGLLYQVTESATATNTLTYHYDYRGSTIALTDGNGNVTDRMEYSLYATTTYRVGTNDTPFLFNGRYGVMTDPNGLLYMRSRYYNPYLCRFINPDPSGFAGGLNFYAYAGGNPVSYLDPFGLNKEATGDDYFSWANPNFDLITSYKQIGAAAAEDNADTVGNVLEFTADFLQGLTPQPPANVVTGTFPLLPGAGGINVVEEITELTDAAEGTATQLEFDFVNNLSPKPAINWAKEAPNYGFAGQPAPATLVPGTLVDRFGYPGGTFVSPQGTPFIQRSLAPGTQYSPYNVYQVLKPIDVNAGQIAPAFGMPGNGMQFQLPSSVQSLIDSGHLGIH